MSAPLPIPFSSEERLLTNSVSVTADYADPIDLKTDIYNLAAIRHSKPERAEKIADAFREAGSNRSVK